jgi:hypothetical protein
LKTIEVQLLAEQVNSPVIHLPGRRYPGVLIQGDSLANLYSTANALKEQCENQHELGFADAELSGLAHELTDLLKGYILQYEAALQAHNIELPYSGVL